MGNDWEKLAGEQGEQIPSGRLGRALKFGRMGAKVAASTLMSRAGSLLSGQPGAEARQQAAELGAKHMVEVMGQLKGASMKIGQLLSADPELVPEGFSDALAGLQRNAPPMTWETVTRQIERALDRPVEAVFRSFDPEPLGAASIGQVHRAVLEDGRTVAVKIQYPGVIEALDSDIKTLGSMMTYARAVMDKRRLNAYLEEVRAVILQETDYMAEGRNLDRFADLLASQQGLRCPRPVMEWTRPGILVMEFVEGVKFDDALAEMPDGPRRQLLLDRWVSTFSWMFHELHELHADPHPGNFMLDADDNLVLLDFGCVRSYDPALTDGLLSVLDCCWQKTPARALEIYSRIDFGRDGFDVRSLDVEIVDGYHRILLEPFLVDAPFDFTHWKPAMEGKMFMLHNPSLFKLAPPPGVLTYFRVLSGIKGLLARVGGSVNVCRMAMDTAERRGLLSPNPKV